MRRTLPILCVSIALLSACGGGDEPGTVFGTIPTSPENVQVPLAKASANLVNDGFSVQESISGWIGDVNTTISGRQSVTDTPAVADTLDGASVLRRSETRQGSETLSTGQTVTIASVRTYYVDPATYHNIKVLGANSTYTIFPPYDKGPDTVKPGYAATQVTGYLYWAGTAPPTLLGTVTRSIEVQENNSVSVLFVVTNEYFDNNGKLTEIYAQTYRIDVLGNVDLMKEIDSLFSVDGTLRAQTVAMVQS